METVSIVLVFLMSLEMIIFLIFIISMAFIFKKAFHPWWGVFIPFYNFWVFLKISGVNPLWGFLLVFYFFGGLYSLLPVFLYLMMVCGLMKAFGKPAWTGIFLFIFPFIFYPILAFSKMKYLGVEESDFI